jgi:hypothetical protein
MTQSLKRNAQDDRRVVELWHQRRREQRRDDDVSIFYGWLADYEPSLIPNEPGSFQSHLPTMPTAVTVQVSTYRHPCHSSTSPCSDAVRESA